MMKRRSALRRGCQEYRWDRLTHHTVLNAKLILLQPPRRWLVDQVFLPRNIYMHGDMLYVRGAQMLNLSLYRSQNMSGIVLR